MAPPRTVPDVPFPPYTYIPGRHPHPISDPDGHSFGQELPTPVPPANDTWQSSREYLYGIDLFNYGYYWEAHEVWESLWHACGRRGVIADFYKGLIKLAAAGVKAREGRPAGVQSHARRARELFECTKEEAGPMLMGLAVGDLDRCAAEIELNAEEIVQKCRGLADSIVSPVVPAFLLPT